MKKCSFLIGLVFSVKALAISGMTTVEKQVMETNLGLKAIHNEIESKKSLAQAARSVYYPTLHGLWGYENNQVKESLLSEKGQVAYLEAKMNLFRGYKDQSTIRQKELEVELVKIDQEKLRRELKLQLTEVLSDMIYLHNIQHILSLESSITKEQNKMAEKKTAAGLTSHVDNLEMTLREQEIEIQIKQIDQLHKQSHEKLVQFLGSEVSDMQIDHLQFENLDQLAKTAKFNIETNPDLRRAHILNQLAELEKKMSESEGLPTLDVSYSYGHLTPGDFSADNFNESKWGLLLNIPLFSGYEYTHKNKATHLMKEAAQEQALQTSLNISSSYNILQSQLQELKDLYKINEQRLDTAKKYFDLTVAEYKRGIKNSPDLVGATERWFSSQKRKYELLKDLELTKVKIENML